MRECFAQAADGLQHAFAVTMCGIDDKDICFGIKKRFDAVFHVRSDTDGSSHLQAAVRVFVRIWVFSHLFDITDGDETFQMAVIVHERQFFDAVRLQDAFRFFHGGMFRSSDQTFRSHDVADRTGQIRLETHITVRNDADQFAILCDRHTGNMVFVHQFVRIRQGVVRSEVDRIHDDAVFRTLDQLHFSGLLINAHILVNDTDAALARHGDRHFCFSDGIHAGAHDRNIQCDILCKVSAYIYVARKDIRMCRDQQHIIKSQSLLAKFVFSHHSLHSKTLVTSVMSCLSLWPGNTDL